MKAKIILFLAVLCLTLTGCLQIGSLEQSDSSLPAASETMVVTQQGSATVLEAEKVNIVNSEGLFLKEYGDGSELWLDKWQLALTDLKNVINQESAFSINGKEVRSGLGYDGLTADGTDNGGYAYIEYWILSGSYDKITGVFGFDDSTKVKPNSKLLIRADDKTIFESGTINGDINSLDIDVPIGADTKTISFRIETTLDGSGLIPKIVFANIAARRMESMISDNSKSLHGQIVEKMAMDTNIIDMLPTINWSEYAKSYGTDETMKLITFVQNYASYMQNMGETECICILSGIDGLDAAYSEGYSAALAELFIRNPELFIKCLDKIDAQKAETDLSYLSYGLDYMDKDFMQNLLEEIKGMDGNQLAWLNKVINALENKAAQ